MVENTVVRLVVSEPKWAHDTLLTIELCWLPGADYNKLKSLVRSYRVLDGSPPSYLNNLGVHANFRLLRIAKAPAQAE